MTLAALEELMTDLAATEDSAAFAQRWEGDPAPFGSVAVAPWNAEVAGGATVRFADGVAPSLGDIEDRFGALRVMPALTDGTGIRAGEWRSVRLFVYGADEPDERPERILLQRAWSPPERVA
jgi:hypothetical protein